jgi:hypothetical protein
MAKVVRVSLTGAEAQLGRVPARDVARLFLGIERVVARAAGHVIGRQVPGTGRRGRLIEDAARLRLIRLERGSVVGVLELPQPSGMFEDASTLSELAWEAALDTASGQDESRIDVASALAQLTTELGIGQRYDAIELGDEQGGRPPVRVDSTQCLRLTRLTTVEPSIREATVVGLLVEADFERMTARVRTGTGEAIPIEFDEDTADAIKEALRHPTEVMGVVTYDPLTLVARAVRVRALTRPEQLGLVWATSEFRRQESVESLAQQLGIEPVTDIESLRDYELSDDDVDAFVAALNE